MAKTRDANLILEQVTGEDEELKQMIAEETINAEVARLIYHARTNAGLTQAKLAGLIGSKQPVIARLEDADYEGHSLTMLQRIAIALNKKIEINKIVRGNRGWLYERQNSTGRVYCRGPGFGGVEAGAGGGDDVEGIFAPAH